MGWSNARIADTGFKGYVAHEFVPTGRPSGLSAQSQQTCVTFKAAPPFSPGARNSAAPALSACRKNLRQSPLQAPSFNVRHSGLSSPKQPAAASITIHSSSYPCRSSSRVLCLIFFRLAVSAKRLNLPCQTQHRLFSGRSDRRARNTPIRLACLSRCPGAHSRRNRERQGCVWSCCDLGRPARLMQIVAHPDDEDGGMLTLQARGHGVSTLLMTLNRGEGGQNKIGSNLSDVLGVLRAEELLASDEYYGSAGRFSRVADFGFQDRRGNVRNGAATMSP